MSGRAKQVIVVRTDLNMRKGKMCAQVAHASSRNMLDALMSVRNCYDPNELDSNHAEVLSWLSDNLSTKIVVGIDSEKGLLDIERLAVEKGLMAHLVKDAGLTEFDKPTYTALALGPAGEDSFIGLTDELRLL